MLAKQTGAWRSGRVPFHRSLIGFGWLATLALSGIGYAQKHSVSVEDCVSLRRIVDGPVISRDGVNVAYVVKAPNIETNQNMYRLMLSSLRFMGQPHNGRPLLSSSDEVSGLRFVNGGRYLSVLLNRSEQFRRPARIETVTLTGRIVGEALSEPQGIVDYSISEDGNTVAYLSPVAPSASDMPYLDPRVVSRGFHFPDRYYDTLMWSKGSTAVGMLTLWIARRDGVEGHWRKSQIPPPVDARPTSGSSSRFEYAYNPSLSPDGKHLAFAYRILNSSDGWMKSRTAVAYYDEFGVKPLGVALYDLDRRRFVDIPEITFPFSALTWSDDSSAFAVVSAAPVGSKWDAADALAHTQPRSPESFHFFAIDVNTKKVSEILKPKQAANLPSIVAWKQAGGNLLVELNRETVSTMKMILRGDEWKEEESLPALAHLNLKSSATVDGLHFVGIHEDAKHPTDLWYADLAQSGGEIQITELNPSVSAFALGDIQEISWKNKYGASLSGKLILPPDSSRQIRYPLVIMLTWPDEDFVCDGHYSTAFPPQPLASAGFAVAIFNAYDAFGDGANRPSGPPQTREAESMMASIESLIDSLDEKGTILRDDVGIIGFSRSSWKVDYFLTHSSFKMKAASSADGGLGNYNSLWITDSKADTEEIAKSYGGLFFGASRSAWLAGAPAFNADKVNTPLLMEYTGAEGRLEEPIDAFEFHSALTSLGKPVDLFFYPHGAHPLDTPFERVASLKRNVDWFRFWMQGYEGAAPAYDPEQYLRWEKLKKLARNAAGPGEHKRSSLDD